MTAFTRENAAHQIIKSNVRHAKASVQALHDEIMRLENLMAEYRATLESRQAELQDLLEHAQANGISLDE